MFEMIELGEICDLQNGYAFKSSDYVKHSNTLNCRMSNIRPNGNLDINYNPKYLPDKYAEDYSKYLLEDNDVVIAMTDMANDPKILGVPTVIKTQGKNLLLNQRVGKLIIKDKEKVYFPYLQYALNRPQVKAYYKSLAGGGVQINIGKNDILKVKIPLPPMSIQKTIVAALDNIKDLINKRIKQIEKIDEFIQSVFLDMFGNPVINYKGWNKSKLGDRCKIFRGGSPRPISNYLGGNIPWIKIGDATRGDTVYLHATKEKIIEEGVKKSRLVKKGNLIFANCGVSLGFARILKFDGCIHDGWLSFEEIDKDINKIFLLKLLNHYTRHFRDSAPDGTQPNLNTGIMKNFEIIIPPTARCKR